MKEKITPKTTNNIEIGHTRIEGTRETQMQISDKERERENRERCKKIDWQVRGREKERY